MTTMTAPSIDAEPVKGCYLPGDVPPVLQAIWKRLQEEGAREVLREMVLAPADYSAEWLAHILSDEAGSISASTIRSYRRALARAGQL